MNRVYPVQLHAVLQELEKPDPRTQNLLRDIFLQPDHQKIMIEFVEMLIKNKEQNRRFWMLAQQYQRASQFGDQIQQTVDEHFIKDCDRTIYHF